jgi:hypothetical protein
LTGFRNRPNRVELRIGEDRDDVDDGKCQNLPGALTVGPVRGGATAGPAGCASGEAESAGVADASGDALGAAAGSAAATAAESASMAPKIATAASGFRACRVDATKESDICLRKIFATRKRLV